MAPLAKVAAIVGLLFGVSSARRKTQDLSSPPAEPPGGATYIMGYGSLMKESSRVKSACKVRGLTASQVNAVETLVAKDALQDEVEKCIDSVRDSSMILVKVKGARRGWYSRGGLQIGDAPEGWEAQALDIAPTYLGAVKDESSSMYAVVYKVTDEELKETDIREQMGSYNAELLESSAVERLDGESFPSGVQIRWYSMTEKMAELPTTQFPICQSYVDLWISGAMELEQANQVPDYAMNVLRTTYGWSHRWVNDRPTAYRPFATEGAAHGVAKLLGQVARENGGAVSESKTMQVLTLDVLKGVRFPDQPSEDKEQRLEKRLERLHEKLEAADKDWKKEMLQKRIDKVTEKLEKLDEDSDGSEDSADDDASDDEA